MDNTEVLEGGVVPAEIEVKVSDPGKDLKNALTYSTISAVLASSVLVFLARGITPPLSVAEQSALMGGLTVVINALVVVIKKLADKHL